MLAAPTLISRPMIIHCGGVSGKEIELIQDGGQIKRQKDIYYRSPRLIPIICHLPDPPPPRIFSLVTTFITINVPVVYMTRYVMVRGGKDPSQGALEWVDPGNQVFFWALNWLRKRRDLR
jgi:hypothetical protein